MQRLLAGAQGEMSRVLRMTVVHMQASLSIMSLKLCATGL